MHISQEDLKLSSYHYHLPKELIAQHPADKRDESRLMILDRTNGTIKHNLFNDLGKYISPKDMLVVNSTSVFPARVPGKKETGGKVEIFLLEYPVVSGDEKGIANVTALIKASKRPREGSRIIFNDHFSCTMTKELGEGKVEVQLYFNQEIGLSRTLQDAGQVPLPPYIERIDGFTDEDTARYQTVYAKKPGAVAAPTAGLHFTKELLTELTGQGCLLGDVTLHVGYGTFAPVRHEDIENHKIHREYLTISQETVDKIQETKALGGKIWAVGTTTARALEYSARNNSDLEPVNDWCDLYIYPGFQFKVVDNLITNFHLPDSSLMFLVAALCGRQTLLDCYQRAIRERYRFFSYGDAMAIISGLAQPL